MELLEHVAVAVADKHGRELASEEQQVLEPAGILVAAAVVVVVTLVVAAVAAAAAVVRPDLDSRVPEWHCSESRAAEDYSPP